MSQLHGRSRTCGPALLMYSGKLARTATGNSRYTCSVVFISNGSARSSGQGVSRVHGTSSGKRLRPAGQGVKSSAALHANKGRLCRKSKASAFPVSPGYAVREGRLLADQPLVDALDKHSCDVTHSHTHTCAWRVFSRSSCFGVHNTAPGCCAARTQRRRVRCTTSWGAGGSHWKLRADAQCRRQQRHPGTAAL